MLAANTGEASHSASRHPIPLRALPGEHERDAPVAARDSLHEGLDELAALESVQAVS